MLPMYPKRDIPCYCEIPEGTLTRLAYECFIERTAPGSLKRRLKSKREKRYLSSLELYPLPKDDVIRILGPGDHYFLHHFFDCRRRVEDVLQKFAHVPFRRWESCEKRLSETA